MKRDQGCPECRQGKHQRCDGTAWDYINDVPDNCRCDDQRHEGER